jgi:hypothetical protein
MSCAPMPSRTPARECLYRSWLRSTVDRRSPGFSSSVKTLASIRVSRERTHAQCRDTGKLLSQLWCRSMVNIAGSRYRSGGDEDADRHVGSARLTSPAAASPREPGRAGSALGGSSNCPLWSSMTWPGRYRRGRAAASRRHHGKPWTLEVTNCRRIPLRGQATLATIAAGDSTSTDEEHHSCDLGAAVSHHHLSTWDTHPHDRIMPQHGSADDAQCPIG